MDISVVTPHGELYKDEVDYIVVSSSENGEFATMHDHIPIVSSMEEGYIKLVRSSEEIYIVLINAVIEFSDNIMTVISQEANIGMEKDSALLHLNEVRKRRIEDNRRRTEDFIRAERELKKQVKKSGAGQL